MHDGSKSPLSTDNFYEVGLNNATDPQFTNSFSNVYTGDSLYVSFYGVLGNHVRSIAFINARTHLSSQI